MNTVGKYHFSALPLPQLRDFITNVHCPIGLKDTLPMFNVFIFMLNMCNMFKTKHLNDQMRLYFPFQPAALKHYTKKHGDIVIL